MAFKTYAIYKHLKLHLYLIESIKIIILACVLLPLYLQSQILRVVTMHHNKDTQKEIIVIEATVWVFWVLFFCISYLLAKVTF